MERLDGHYITKCVQRNLSHANQGSDSVPVKIIIIIIKRTWISSHKNRLKAAVEIKLNNSREQI